MNYAADGSELERRVLDGAKIKKGGSIFLLDKGVVTANVESAVANVRVVNIEKKFPNAVYINYVKVAKYLRVEVKNKSYYLSNSLRFIAEETDGADNALLPLLKIKGELSDVSDGGFFASNEDGDNTGLKIIMSALEQIITRDEFLKLFGVIDLSKNSVFLKTRAGVAIELPTLDNAFEKLRYGISAYNDMELQNDSKINSGTIIVSWLNDEKKPRAQYTPENRY
jgi:hypothetical protein